MNYEYQITISVIICAEEKYPFEMERNLSGLYLGHFYFLYFFLEGMICAL